MVHQLSEELFVKYLNQNDEAQILTLFKEYEFTKVFLDEHLSKIINLDMVEVFQYIYKKQGSPYSTNYRWISKAIDSGSVKILRFLLELGWDMEERDPILKDTAILWASAGRSGKQEIVDFLIKDYFKGDTYKARSILRSSLTSSHPDLAVHIFSSYFDKKTLEHARDDSMFFWARTISAIQSYEVFFVKIQMENHFFGKLLEYVMQKFHRGFGYALEDATSKECIHFATHLLTNYPPFPINWPTFRHKMSWNDMEYLDALCHRMQTEENSEELLEELLIRQIKGGNETFVKKILASHPTFVSDKEKVREAAKFSSNVWILGRFLHFDALPPEQIHTLMNEYIRKEQINSIELLIKNGYNFLPKAKENVLASLSSQNIDILKIFLPYYPNLSKQDKFTLASFFIYFHRLKEWTKILLEHKIPIGEITDYRRISMFLRMNDKTILSSFWDQVPDDILSDAGLSVIVIRELLDQSVEFIYPRCSYCPSHGLELLLNIEQRYEDSTPYDVTPPEVYVLRMNYHDQDPNDTPFPKIFKFLISEGAEKALINQHEAHKLILRHLWVCFDYLLSLEYKWDWDISKLAEICLQEGQDKILRLLLENWEMTNIQNSHICSSALKNNSQYWIDYFQSQPLDLTTENRNGHNLLLTESICAQNIGFIDFLLRNDVDPNDFSLAPNNELYIMQNGKLLEVLRQYGYNRRIPIDKSDFSLVL
jgi:hypothetical protein